MVTAILCCAQTDRIGLKWASMNRRPLLRIELALQVCTLIIYATVVHYSLATTHDDVKAMPFMVLNLAPFRSFNAYYSETLASSRAAPAPPPAPPARPPADSLVCEDDCTFARDTECDDGGPGSEYYRCDYGHDCTDCGTRGLWQNEDVEVLDVRNETYEEDDHDDLAQFAITSNEMKWINKHYISLRAATWEVNSSLTDINTAYLNSQDGRYAGVRPVVEPEDWVKEERVVITYMLDTLRRHFEADVDAALARPHCFDGMYDCEAGWLAGGSAQNAPWAFDLWVDQDLHACDGHIYPYKCAATSARSCPPSPGSSAKCHCHHPPPPPFPHHNSRPLPDSRPIHTHPFSIPSPSPHPID